MKLSSNHETVRLAFSGAVIDIEGAADHMPATLFDGMPSAAYVPVDADSRPPDGRIRVAYGDQSAIDLDRDSWTINLTLPADGVEIGHETLYLAQGLAEGIRQPRGFFLAHAAATISPSGEGHLLVGTQGSGKTATTMALCLEQGHQLVGNDLVLMRTNASPDDTVRNVELLDGTKHLHVRRTAVLANPFLAALSLGMPEAAAGTPSFMDKVRIDSDALGIASAQETAPIVAVWRVWLDGQNNQPVSVSEQSGMARSLFTSELLGRFVSGIIAPLKSADGQMILLPPSFDSPEAQRRRIAAGNHLSNLCQLVTGPSGSEVADLIAHHAV